MKGARMPAQSISEQLKAKILELVASGVSNSQIAIRLGISRNTVLKYQQLAGIPSTAHKPNPGIIAEPIQFDVIRKALRKGPLSTDALADALDCSPRRVTEALEGMKARGALLRQNSDGAFELTIAEACTGVVSPILATHEKWNHRLGVVSDNHLCNKHSRLDVLNAAYDDFEREGITDVFNSGNWIDGEHKFTRPESIVRPGMDAQIEYLLENYPQKKGITTHYIAGDDHEGWYQQRECIEIGLYLQLCAEKAGRHDLKYLGYAEADVPLKSPGGTIVMRVVHPGGGSAYAISYTDQKRVESYQGGKKPQIEIVGHYHKYNVGYPREVYTVQAGCTCDQTLFMRKKRLQAMVGYCIIEIQQDTTDGHLCRARHEFIPFYDRGYYEKRYK